MEGRVFENFQKSQKVFKFPKMPKIDPKNVQTCFEHALGRFFPIIFAQCSMQGFSDFLDLKTWVLFYETILNRHSFCIHAIVNKRNPFPDFLDLKLWVRIPELKTMCSFFWTETIWIRFSGLKIRGRYLEKIQEKNQEAFKFLKLSKIVLKCQNVFWGIFFKKNFFPSVPRKFESSKNFKNPKRPKIVHKSIQTCFEHVLGRFFWKSFFAQCSVESSKIFKKLKKTQNCKNAQNRFQNCPNLFWTCFVTIFSKKKVCPVFPGGPGFRKYPKKSKKFQNSESVQNRSQICPNMFWTCFGAIFPKNFLPSVPCRAFQIFWT